MRLELGISPCPNDVFIFAGIILGTVRTEGLEFHIRYEDVETLNRVTQFGNLDVAKISCANYVLCEKRYELLHCGGALGRGVGPLLLTNGAEFDPGATVLVPGRHTTANFLLDFYLRDVLPGARIQKEFAAFDSLYDELLAQPDSQGVVIHEKRFTYQKDGLRLVQDLGEHWETRTGYPIPLGAIVALRELNIVESLEDLIQ